MNNPADFVQSNIQLTTPQQQIVLPPGWRSVFNHDGRIYYQNDITKETSWNLPSNSATIEQQPIIYGDDYDENEEDIAERKIWDLAHIILLVGIVMHIYDYYTDIAVAQSWFKLSSYCAVKTRFKCEFESGEYDTVIWGVLLIVCSSLGFMAGFIFICKEAKALYLIYKYPIKQKDLIQSNSINSRRLMLCGWIPLRIEDFLSLCMTYVIWGGYGLHVAALNKLYTKSMVMSTISIFFNTLMSCRSHRKLRKLGIYAHARACHCCWCCCLGTSTIICFVALLILLAVHSIIPIVSINGVYPSENNYIECNDYFIGGSADKEDVYAFSTNNLMKYPNWIYNNCSGNDYTYSIECYGNSDEIIVNCVLYWEYKYNDINNDTVCGDIDFKNDICIFDIELETCGNYSIICKNDIMFVDSSPQIWACFDYCKG